MKGSYRKVYTSAHDFFELDGNIVMQLTAAAAIEVCVTAANRGLLVFRIEGGIWRNPGFEARLDCIWNGADPPLSREAAADNNRAAADFISHQSDVHDVFIVSTTPITGYPDKTGDG